MPANATFTRVPLTATIELSALLPPIQPPDIGTVDGQVLQPAIRDSSCTTATLQRGADLRAEMSRLLQRCLPRGSAPSDCLENDAQLDALCAAVSSQLWQRWLESGTHSTSSTANAAACNNTVQTLAARYKRIHSRYAPAPAGQVKLGHAYESLVAGAGGRFFDRLLTKEEEMVTAARALQMNRAADLKQLAERHARELELVGASDRRRGHLPELRRTQSAQLQASRSSWDGQREELYRRQKAEHTAFTLALYQEMVAGAPAPKDATPAAVITSPQSQTEASSAPHTEPVSSPSSVAGHSAQPAMDAEMAGLAASLTEMGFTEKQAVAALTLTKRQLDRAIVMLLEQPAVVDNYLAQQSAEQTSKPSTPSVSGTPPHSPLERSSGSRANWNAIGFLEEKLNNSSSNLKKVSSWFDKAKAQFEDILDSDSPGSKSSSAQQQPAAANTDHMVESFTITVGAQIRRVHNLRLMVARMDSLLTANVSAAEIAAMHAQTSATLYSRTLSGLVLLADVNSIAQYRLGVGSAKALFVAAQKQCELHFPDYEAQMSGIEHAWSDNTLSPSEGDVFITRHSNIPGVHVIFHLCVDYSGFKAELVQRSPVISGIRNILMAAHRFEVKTLTMPLLLLPDSMPELTASGASGGASTPSTARPSILSSLHRSSSNNSLQTEAAMDIYSDAFLAKRSELILKSVKAMMLELSRSYGKHGDTRHGATASDERNIDSNTVQFVLPPWLARDSTFEAMRNMLRSVYRTV